MQLAIKAGRMPWLRVVVLVLVRSKLLLKKRGLISQMVSLNTFPSNILCPDSCCVHFFYPWMCSHCKQWDHPSWWQTDTCCSRLELLVNLLVFKLTPTLIWRTIVSPPGPRCGKKSTSFSHDLWQQWICGQCKSAGCVWSMLLLPEIYDPSFQRIISASSRSELTGRLPNKRCCFSHSIALQFMDCLLGQPTVV